MCGYQGLNIPPAEVTLTQHLIQAVTHLSGDEDRLRAGDAGLLGELALEAGLKAVLAWGVTMEATTLLRSRASCCSLRISSTRVSSASNLTCGHDGEVIAVPRVFMDQHTAASCEGDTLRKGLAVLLWQRLVLAIRNSYLGLEVYMLTVKEYAS